MAGVAVIINPIPQPVFEGTRGRVLAVLCAATDRLSGGQIARASNSTRSTCHGVLRELVEIGVARRRDHPSVTMFELEDNAIARAMDTLHDDAAHAETRVAAVLILRHVLPQWSDKRTELNLIAAAA